MTVFAVVRLDGLTVRRKTVSIPAISAILAIATKPLNHQTTKPLNH